MLALRKAVIKTIKPVNRVDLGEGKECIIITGEDPEKLISRYRGCLGNHPKRSLKSLLKRLSYSNTAFFTESRSKQIFWARHVHYTNRAMHRVQRF